MADPTPEIDWSLTTFEGSRRAQLRRWSALTVRQRLEALDGMTDTALRLHRPTDDPRRHHARALHKALRSITFEYGPVSENSLIRELERLNDSASSSAVVSPAEPAASRLAARVVQLLCWTSNGLNAGRHLLSEFNGCRAACDIRPDVPRRRRVRGGGGLSYETAEQHRASGTESRAVTPLPTSEGIGPCAPKAKPT